MLRLTIIDFHITLRDYVMFDIGVVSPSSLSWPAGWPAAAAGIVSRL